MKLLIRPLTLFAFLVTGFFSYAQQPSSPLELNDYFVSINDTLYSSGKEWGSKLNEVYASKEFSLLETARVKMETFIERKIAELKKLKDINGSEKFRLAMLDFLNFENKMMKEAFRPFEKLNKASSEEDIKKAIAGLTELAKNEDTELQKVNKAQQDYAVKNGFTIEGIKE
jgi:hypothetical protein